jgi:predicted PurR-regulated permease PerM
MLIIPAVVSDLIANNHLMLRSKQSKTNNTSIIAGAIIGSMFYIMGYPMLPITFAEPLSYTFNSIDDILVNFIDTLSIAIVPTTVFGIIMGIIGAIIATKKIIKILEANNDVPSSRMPKQTDKKLH